MKRKGRDEEKNVHEGAHRKSRIVICCLLKSVDASLFNSFEWLLKKKKEKKCSYDDYSEEEKENVKKEANENIFYFRCRQNEREQEDF